MEKKRFRTAPALLILGPILILGLAAAGFIPLQCLTLRLPKEENKLVFLTPAAPGERFFVSYRHSVEKTRVKGIFQVSDEGEILAVETRMTSVGTGLPNTFPGRTRKEGDWMVVDEEMAVVEDFRFFVVPVNQTVLSMGKHSIQLDTFRPGTIVLIDIEPLSWLQYLGTRAGDFFSNPN